MSPRVLSDAELEALEGWPPEVARSDLVEHFTLDVDDLRWVRSHRGAATRLGLGVQLCALRFLGFVPSELASTPAEVVQRIAKIADKPRWRPHPPGHYARWPLAGPLLAERAQTDVIEEQWDELCRVAGSLKLGYVSASLLVARLQAGARQHPLAKALLEYGKLLRTLHALRWFTDEAFRRRIGRQLNKGESLNDLRRFIAYADADKEKYRRHEDQTAQAHCLSLVVNICILSTTWYLQDSAEAHQAEGQEVTDEVIAHISPCHFGALNPYGTHSIDVALGFELDRVRGSHHIDRHPGGQRLNLQSRGGQAKPYQLRQLLELVERHALRIKEDDE